LIRHDLTSGTLNPAAAVKYITKTVTEDRQLTYHVLEDQATGKNANTTFLVFEGRTWTYKEFVADLQRVGNWLMNDLGIQKNEIVAINGGNSPEYLLLWFGLDAIGAVPSFINCNLTLQPLVHCVKLCESRYLICDEDVRPLVDPTEAELTSLPIPCKPVYYSRSTMEALSNTTPTPEHRRKGMDPNSIRSLIYTSGTTGLPKATIMWTAREMNTGHSVADYLQLKPGKSRMYTCMPLYHGAAHGLCITPSIHAGSTVILSRKFSHKTFWPEVSANKATIIQYVGELCRYLVNAPTHPLERSHVVTMAWGNGMRPDVWEAFRTRFNIPVINELYAATDGLGASFNYNRGPFGANAIGRRGLLWRFQNSSKEVRVKIDVVTEDILRNPSGFAIPCRDGEAGEVLHKLDPAAPNAMFQGYFHNKTASDKRMIKDVFEKGDLWFRSGDMQRQDPDGCVYFVDRLGDTFRWKSENVSTNEVSDVVGKFPQIAETNVYGVAVPHSDGRAGCAAVVLADGVELGNVDWKGLATYLIATLPRYAVPIFVRVVRNLEYTGTMKLQKGRMRADGVDPSKMGEDRMWWLPIGGTEYVPFTEKDWEGLKDRSVRL
jgi:acyl-CoA synthetase (AMP-forming)/AMP-acid ligase II